MKIKKLNRKNYLSALMLGSFFLILGLFTYCQGEKSIKPSIQGEWRALFDECMSEEESIIKICDRFVETRSQFLTNRVSYLISESANADGSYQMASFDFQYSNNGVDFEDVFTYGSKDTLMGKIFFLQDDIFVGLTYKGGSISHEYVSSAALIRNYKVQEREFKPTVSTVLVLPDEFRGYSWVAIEQPHGEPIRKDNKGRLLIEIPENGKLETQAEVSPVALALRELGFFFREDWNKWQTTIPAIPHECLTLFQIQKFSDDEIIDYGYDPDKVYVHYSRYNPARELVNKAFNKEIKGQVFTFRVDTLRNLLKTAPMVE